MPGDASGFPPFISPMLAVPARQLPPDADDWTAEVKWDGLRAITAISRGRVRIWSRAGRDITAAYPSSTPSAA
jgi:bifunctional non-homologous end joining protein LigD